MLANSFFDKDDYFECDKPIEIPENAVREGTYSIRRQGVDMLKDYEYVESVNKWFERGESFRFDFRIRIGAVEYNKLMPVYKYLSKYWYDQVWAYHHFIAIRELQRGVRKTFLKD